MVRSPLLLSNFWSKVERERERKTGLPLDTLEGEGEGEEGMVAITYAASVCLPTQKRVKGQKKISAVLCYAMLLLLLSADAVTAPAGQRGVNHKAIDYKIIYLSTLRIRTHKYKEKLFFPSFSFLKLLKEFTRY